MKKCALKRKSWMKRKPSTHKQSKDPRVALRKKLTIIFNKFIRLRDAHLPCISCGVRRVTEAGHYWPTGTDSHPAMRYNEENVNGQCTYCNGFCEGARQGYREGLIRKYGPAVLTSLDIQRSVRQNSWQEFEYRTYIAIYQKKVSEFERDRA